MAWFSKWTLFHYAVSVINEGPLSLVSYSSEIYICGLKDTNLIEIKSGTIADGAHSQWWFFTSSMMKSLLGVLN